MGQRHTLIPAAEQPQPEEATPALMVSAADPLPGPAAWVVGPPEDAGQQSQL